MAESARTTPDARLPAAVDDVLGAARRWRARRARWSSSDEALEYRIWLDLRDLQDCRDRPDGADDLPAATSRLLEAVRASGPFPPEARELHSAIDNLDALRHTRSYAGPP
jgi:hypothetical protein